KTIINRKGKENFVFYEGPPTANGMPGIHHVVSRVLKDTICKYKVMSGYRVVRKAGWDTHGLPVEIEVEKELGLKSKNEIEEYGIEAFNEKCKESVFRNEKAFADMTRKMGYFIDLKNPYITYHNNYIETEWWILKKFFEEGLIYEGHKVLPYCARCGTGVSTHEVASGYQDVSVDTVIVPMKMVNEDTYFLVWTTTPWTLISNVALAVNPQATYVKVKSRDYQFIIAESLAEKILSNEYEVLQKYQGKELEYIEYEQLIPSLKVDKKAFYVTLADFVTLEDGTGIVHMAPAFGEDDYQVGKQYDLPVLNPVGEDGKFIEGLWQGKFVIDADEEIIKYLKENDKLFKKERIKHNYPHCWRCHTPLLYYAKPSWYIEMSKLKDQLIKNNNSVKWVPSFVGEKRFGNWLENLKDWAISRNRYWGTPLNIWKCDCGHIESIGSRKELMEKAIEDIDMSIDLHRPYVDDIHIKCPKCNKKMSRVKEVIDCWFDSGSMPFAQYHYPFENEDIFKEQFPADYICEGIDQTRGWFYSLIAISTFVTGKSPYKSVLVNDLLLDKDGQKMSKSRGNAINPFELFEKYGADALRWYLLYVSPVWNPTKFNLDELKEVQSKFFNTLKNTYGFFELYANTDNVDPRQFTVPYDKREEIDKWILSKYNQLIKDVRHNYEEYDLTKVTRLISEFVNEDLSNWYIRRNRRRFWASELDANKKAVYNTTYEVLVGLTKLIAPIVPFISEEMYQKLTNEESVHLADFPLVNENLIDEKLETKMDLVRQLITLGRWAREEAKIKVRQPLSEVIIDAKHQVVIDNLTDLIKEELNVQKVTYVSDLKEYMNFEIKPNYRVAGPIFENKIQLFANKLSILTNEQIEALNNNNVITLEVDGTDYEINNEMVDIRIKAKTGFNAGMLHNLFIIINTDLNEDLINEGIARELISKVQQMRKNLDFNVSDRINIYYEADESFNQVLKHHLDFIKAETLAINLIQTTNLKDIYDLNGLEVGLKIEQITNY
ncbi:MAG: isoleucine--tRNA ligase, partial [Bacilli bacterium]|nr:isoleucine--tRNA ligase [Bacilli bacterium]